MIRAIIAANGAGYRAGRAEPCLVTPGGTRGIKRLSEPTNPFADTFNPQRRNWFLALAWDTGRIEGMRDRLARPVQLRVGAPAPLWRVRHG